MDNLKLLYITNNPKVAAIAEQAGVDRIFIDLETIGKDKRQQGRDTVKSSHHVTDIREMKNALTSTEILVRVNPIYNGSKDEIDRVIKNGADIVMLPMIKSDDDVKTFLEMIGGRCKTCLLIETAESVEIIESILKLSPDSEYFIGLNDLHLSYNQSFMFEPLADGTVEKLCRIFQSHHVVRYGFGGIARVGEGMLPAEKIIAEHHRLGSGMVILSRTFCDVSKIDNMDAIKARMQSGVKAIRDFEKKLEGFSKEDFEANTKDVIKGVNQIINIIKNRGENE